MDNEIDYIDYTGENLTNLGVVEEQDQSISELSGTVGY